MRPSRHRPLLFFVSVLLCTLPTVVDLPAQQAFTSPPMTALLSGPLPDAMTISKRVDEVSLLFTVTDSKGRFITDLGQQDFQVLDNHLPPESIRLFQQQSDLPLRVGLVIDLSDSISERFKFEKRAAATFLKKVLRPGDQAFVMGFGDKVVLEQDFTGDAALLSASLQKMKPKGNTSFYDALVLAARKLQQSRQNGPVRRVLIVITDGQDTCSHSILADAEQASTRAEASIFALSTNDVRENNYPKGEAVLDILTKYSGGQILRAREDSQLLKAFSQVDNALRSQYMLAYKPAAFTADGSFREIELLPARHKLRIQCRRGYFAPREGQ